MNVFVEEDGLEVTFPPKFNRVFGIPTEHTFTEKHSKITITEWDGKVEGEILNGGISKQTDYNFDRLCRTNDVWPYMFSDFTHNT